MSVKFANNAFGTLNAGISNSATSVTLSSGQGARFPTLASGEYFYATLIDTSNNLEVVKCTARSTDVLTITRAQESTTAQAFAIGDRIELRVTAAGLTDAANPYDKDTSSTGSFALPSGTEAEEPTAADSEGHIRYNTDDNVVYYSNGTEWLKVSSVQPILTSATGNIYAGAASTLTLAGTGFQSANLVVNFTQSSDSINEDVTVTPTSDTAATVTVPAAVYNNVTAGNVVSITVTNSDGITSAVVTKTALALPSGGTVSTSGNYRIHTFTSSGNFVTPSGVSLTADYLVVAGGGAGSGMTTGGSYHGASAGGGAGGVLSGSTSISAQTYAVVVGAGGANNGGGAVGSNGSNTTIFGLAAVGGGYGGRGNSGVSGNSGGSGGGGTREANSAGSGTSGQGNAGGTYSGASAGGSAGGGGGWGAVGGSGGVDPGAGGVGQSNSITGSSIFYAGGGGGGGGGNIIKSGASGGNGGGGAGGANSSVGSTTGIAGTANRGGGGGGGGSAQDGSTATTGGSGGSGIVIIRYQL